MATVEERLLILEKACLQLTNMIASLKATVAEHESRLDKQGVSVKAHQNAIEGLQDSFNRHDNVIANVPSLVTEEIDKQTAGRLWDNPR